MPARTSYHPVDLADPNDRSRSSSPALFQPSARPPPSSYTFPFQAYPGNPDPGMTIPGYSRRRSSLDSISYRGAPTPTISDSSHPQLLATRKRAASLSDELPPPNAPFMASATGGTSSGTSSESNSLRHSPSSNSLYKASAAAAASTLPRNSSTHSFRAPFLAPSSRPSSWVPPPNPGTPSASSTALALAYANGLPLPKNKPPSPSTRLAAPLTKEDKPWIDTRQPRVRTSYFLTLLFIVLGLGGAGVLCYFGYSEIPLLDESKLCKVMDDSFSGSQLNSDNWNVEVQTGGFGNGEFQMTTASQDNLFIKNGQLYIYPTLTSEALGIDIFDGTNFTLDGCTAEEAFTSYVGPAQGATRGGNRRASCSASGNRALGTVVPPVISARINTKGKKTMRYGKLEVTAKLPRGDWLWPAIWMLPEESKYGVWPMSGEIDLLEARGNGPEYPRQGVNFVRSSLNYGPLPSLYTQIFGWQGKKQTSFDKAFHTYTLEWTPDFIRMYVDKRLLSMLEVKNLRTNKRNFWARGNYPQVANNWTSDGSGNGDQVVVKNIWAENDGDLNAPFDQPFFLIINLAVGGTSGWFPDPIDKSNKDKDKLQKREKHNDKPWFDESQTAMLDFANAQDQWSKTWPKSREDRSFRINSVKMWEICTKKRS